MNINTDLRIKYGLINDPSDLDVTRWHMQYLRFRVEGLEPEHAGHRAAKEVFPDYGRMKYASNADTIESLLEEIKRRGK